MDSSAQILELLKEGKRNRSVAVTGKFRLVIKTCDLMV